jgi:hypothetical protein
MATPHVHTALLSTLAGPIRPLGVRASGVDSGWWWFYGRPSEEAVCA